MDELFVISLGLPAFLLCIDLMYFLVSGKRIYPNFLNKSLDLIVMAIYPLLYLYVFDERINNCCSDSAVFSPEHKLTIYFLIILCVVNYFYAVFKKTVHSPVLEVLSNTLLLAGFTLNIFVAVHVKEWPLWLLGNLPVALLFLFQLLQNHRAYLLLNKPDSALPLSFLEKTGWKILHAPLLIKVPLFLILCLPVLTIITILLLLFGQKPDSLIRAFTDTYKHGFSQLDYECENVTCDGHYLCTVAAKGHKHLVHPQRMGIRNGQPVVCNRQLLVANAFEELLQEKVPRVHRFIRSQYNKVGKLVHRHYGLFNIKWISDLVYLLMKPLEWFFVFVLYTFDRKPENRIAKQYLSPADRKAMAGLSSTEIIP